MFALEGSWYCMLIAEDWKFIHLYTLYALTYTLVCSWKSPVLYPTAKLFWVILDLAVSKVIW